MTMSLTGHAHRKRLALAHASWIMAVSSVFLPALASADAPTVDGLFPAGGQRGSTVVASCIGKFQWPLSLRTHGVTIRRCEESGKLKITIPDDLASDRVWVRFYNDQGASAKLPFLIGSLVEIEEIEPNNSIRDAQPIAKACIVVNGRLEKTGDVDAFAVNMLAGQTLVASVDAHRRIGSPIDAVLQVVTTHGIVVTENHDDVGLDPRIAFTASHSGTYIVRLFAFPSKPDSRIRYFGADRSIYRLTLTTGPFMTHAMPLSIRCDNRGDVDVIGWNLPPTDRHAAVPLWRAGKPASELAPFDDFRMSSSTIPGIVYHAAVAGAARLRIEPSNVSVRSVSNNSSHDPAIEIPCSITGWLKSPKQTDTYRIHLQPGQRIIVAVEAQTLNLPTVPFVRLINPKGAVAAQSPERGPRKDVVIRHAPSLEGEYRVRVGDRFASGGDRHLYRLTVRSDTSDFALSTATDSIVARAGESTDLVIDVDRHSGIEGPIGPISIEAIDLPPGISSTVGLSESKGESAGKVTIQLTAAGPAYSGPIRVRGTANQPSTRVRYSHTPPRFGATFEEVWLTVVADAHAESPAN